MKKILVSVLMLFGLFGFSQAAVLDDAVIWMYTNGLTIFKITKDYQPNSYIRRDEAAKLFVKFAKIVEKDTYKKTVEECKFSDLNDAHADLKDIVVESCRMGIFQGANGKFMPRGSLTNEQAVTVLVRILVGNQSETGVSYWSENYYKVANEQGMLSQVNMSDRKSLASRGNVGVVLYMNSSINNGNTSDIIGIFKDDELKIQFEYYKWDFSVEKEKDDYNGMIFVNTISPDKNVLLVAQNGKELPARGAGWGDMSHFIDSQSWVDNFCTLNKNSSDIKSCSVKSNKNGVKYVKVERTYGVMGEDTLYNKIEYYIYNPHSEYRGIVLSTERIGIQIENSLQLIVDSLQFIK